MPVVIHRRAVELRLARDPQIAVAMALLVAASVALLAWAFTPHERHYFRPMFAPDGTSVYAMERDASATMSAWVRVL